MTHTTPPAHTRSQSGRTLLVTAMLVAGMAGLAGVWLATQSHAEEGAVPLSHRYLAISGHGAQARAWYDGAAPSGVPVQEALDTFAEEGYRVVETTQSVDVRGEQTLDRWTILMSK